MSERWTIQGVDRALRDAVTAAAKSAGQTVGEWVASALNTALSPASDSSGPLSSNDAVLASLAIELSQLRSRVEALEKSATVVPATPVPVPPARAVLPPASPAKPTRPVMPLVPPPPAAIVPPHPPVLTPATPIHPSADMDEALAAEAVAIRAGRLSEATRQRICDLAGRSYSVLQIAKKTGVRVSVVEKVLRSRGRENLQVKIL